ncbi:MAG TPA: hypothetical protein VKJ01_22175, partial [Candidatus Solibacter sp.]|nr:hypothetical protein [Candidatus Solibacter sp.]
MLKSLRIFPICLVAAVCVTQAQTVEGNIAIDKLLERITLQEQSAVQKLRSRSAVLETYIQELSDDPNAAEQGERDHYFLGRLELAKGLNYVPLVARSELSKGSRLGFLKARASIFLP